MEAVSADLGKELGLQVFSAYTDSQTRARCGVKHGHAERRSSSAQVRGIVPPSSSFPSGAFTVRLEGERSTTDVAEVTAPAGDLTVVEASAPLPEASLSFPKTLNGLERKFVHASAEALGLLSQSFGEGQERYITAFRPAQQLSAVVADAPSVCPLRPPRPPELDAGAVESCGLELDAASQEQLLQSVAVPVGWQAFADRLTVCQGSFGQPKDQDHRSVAAEVAAQVQSLVAGSPAEVRVVSAAQGRIARTEEQGRAVQSRADFVLIS